MYVYMREERSFVVAVALWFQGKHKWGVCSCAALSCIELKAPLVGRKPLKAGPWSGTAHCSLHLMYIFVHVTEWLSAPCATPGGGSAAAQAVG